MRVYHYTRTVLLFVFVHRQLIWDTTVKFNTSRQGFEKWVFITSEKLDDHVISP